MCERQWQDRYDVDEESGCWIYSGWKDKGGYGRMSDSGRASKSRLAHRSFYTLANGPIPDGLCVLHRCDNPPCVNPDHLFLGTQQDNIRDMEIKGRGRKAFGDNQAKAILVDATAREIIDLVRLTKMNQSEIASLYGVSGSAVSSLATGKTWKHIGMENRYGRGRARRGSSHSMAKLDEDQVVEIRAMIASGKSNTEIAKAYGVTRHAISLIVRRKTWKHVP